MYVVGGATAGKINFCAALVRAGFAGGAADAAPQARQLGELGVRGLAKLRQLPVLRQLIAKYNIELKDNGGFYLTWIKGQQQFAQAETSKAANDYEAAAKTLDKALNDPQARADVSSAGDCRYTLAWCHYRLDRFEQAAPQFQQAAVALQESSSDAAVQAAWMAFVSYQRLSGTESRFVSTAIETLQAIKRDFPSSEQAKKADYYIAKLQQSAATPEESIRTLSQIKPGEPNYLSARYELCLLYHQQWSKERGDARIAPVAAAEVLRAVDQYLEESKNDADQERKLKCTLLAVDVALNATPPNDQQAAAYLAKTAAVADLLPTSSPSLAEYHYRCWQAARQAGDQAVEQHAMWLARNAAGSIYELPAIVTLARRADEAVDAATASERPARQESAARIYQRLVQLLGDSPEAMTAKKNSLVANSKLAHYEHDLGRYAAAANRLDRILSAYPNEKAYLRRAGLAHFAAGDFAAALPHWRTLLSGLDNDADDWYEAKYYQLECLLQTDKTSAKQVYDQFKLLHPELGPEPWKAKFRELDSALR